MLFVMFEYFGKRDDAVYPLQKVGVRWFLIETVQMTEMALSLVQNIWQNMADWQFQKSDSCLLFLSGNTSFPS